MGEVPAVGQQDGQQVGQQEGGSEERLSIEQGMTALQQLMELHGSAAAIPEADLAKIGYIRVITSDGAVRLRPRSAQPVAPESATERAEFAPFQTVEFSVPSAGRQLEIPRGGKLNAFRQNLTELAAISKWEPYTCLSDFSQLVPGEHALIHFFEELSRTLGGQSSTDESQIILGNIVHDLLNTFDNVDILEKSDTQFDLVEQLEVAAEDEQDLIDELEPIQTDEATQAVKDVSERLEVTRGVITNRVVLVSFFDSYLTDDATRYLEVPDEAEDGDGIIAMLLSKKKDQQPLTVFDVCRYAISSVAVDKNLVTIAEAISDTKTSGEMLSIVRQNCEQLIATQVAEEKRIKTLIGNANSDDEKLSLNRTYSGELAAIAEQKKVITQFQTGLRAFFALPDAFAREMDRRIDALQELLIAGTKKPGRPLKVQLDARPDSVRDKNPGEISGDCTDGYPLPFAEKRHNLHNVKVFVEGKHRGNIYLLVTTDSEENIVWHLEAIQIPDKSLDWNKAYDSLMNALITEAEKKGVRAITCNSVSQTISNYSYISDVVQSHLLLDDKIVIKIPYIESDKRYSQLQTQETADSTRLNPKAVVSVMARPQQIATKD